MSDTHNTGQFIHEIVLIEDDASQNHGELMPSLLTCHMQKTTSTSTPLVHTNTYGNKSFSSQHNRDPMIMEPFGQCGYVLSQQSMFPVNNHSHCMPYTAQFRPHNLMCMCGQSHCSFTAGSINHQYGNSCLCNEPNVHNVNNCNYTCRNHHGSESIVTNSLHDRLFSSASHLDSEQSNVQSFNARK